MGCENKFKVGDRVHYDDRLTKGVGTIHLRAPENEGFDWGVAVAEHDRMRAYHKGNVRWFLARDLRPALTIEPGRHYRTRSGKPTGRVTVGDTGFEAIVDGRVRIFDKAGGAVHGDDDIVEAWVPKVGERVVEAEPKRYNFLRHWFDYWRSVEGVLTDNAFVVTKVCGATVHYSNRVDGNGPIAGVADFEPLPVAPQPAAPTLKIEEGRYYRTRAGRKVGPMRNDKGIKGYRWDGRGTSQFYDDQGSADDGTKFDLVAEWQETTNVGAQVDTLAEEYGPAPASNDNAAKPKFKVRDRVKLAAIHDMAAYGRLDGETGTVMEDSSVPYVKWDRDGAKLAILEKEADLIATTPTVTTSAIVALIENGQPKPAAIPHVHANQAAAEREAKRLAGVHKGKRFGVFVLTTTAEEAAPTYRHEWQRLAVAGKKIDAIRELRGLTGMQLKPAKDVVEHFVAYPYGQAA